MQVQGWQQVIAELHSGVVRSLARRGDRSPGRKIVGSNRAASSCLFI